ncbi:MAG: hypothetical protein AAF456_23515, partial [Planctomycetota bacterium]
IVFLNFDWSILGLQKRQFAAFALDYQSRNRTEGALLHFLDCTASTDGHQPLKQLSGWNELQSKRQSSLVHGSGELVWLSKGQVLDVQPISNFASSAELTSFTERLFADNRIP